jgi:membrane carboxypeptidase/penicillin-binding protein
MKEGADGVNVAAPIWRNFMNFALSRKESRDFPGYDSKEALKDIDRPMLNGELEEEKEMKVCEIPGKDNEYCKANDNCSSKQEKKRTFINAHSILYYVNKDNPSGAKPDKPTNDPQYKAWEKGIEEYYKKDKKEDKIILQAPPEDECKADDFQKN